MQAEWAPYTLDFKFEARTSRESMRHKDTFFVRIPRADGSGHGVGECALFKGLSEEPADGYTDWLSQACKNPMADVAVSSIQFGLETAKMNAGYVERPTSDFLLGKEGIPINGLIWMGDRATMKQRIDEKLDAGFKVLKMKIGGIDFESEVELLEYIRKRYPASVLELRLDANGSFTPENAMQRLERLASFDIHSIEQPIKAGQTRKMATLCRRSPIAIALDEELIGLPSEQSVKRILDEIIPQYIILKPALCGGLSAADLWADEAERRSIGWWATSALESNVGLLAIATWVAARGVTMPQGLGTGQLYYNNIPSGLYLKGDRLYYNADYESQFPDLEWRR